MRGSLLRGTLLRGWEVALVLKMGEKRTDFFTAIAEIGFISYSLADRQASAALTSRVAFLGGEFYYRWYLLHGAVPFALVYMTDGKLPFFGITIVLATAKDEVVKVPPINMGNTTA